MRIVEPPVQARGTYFFGIPPMGGIPNRKPIHPRVKPGAFWFGAISQTELALSDNRRVII